MNLNDKIHLAVQHYQTGNIPQSESLCLEILSREPENSSILHLLGYINYLKNNFELAITHISRSVQLNPLNALAHHTLGDAYRKQGQLDQAIVSYQQALSLNNNFVEAHINLGLVYQEKGLLDEAIAQYSKVIELKPELSETYYNLGTIFQDKMKMDQAASYYLKTVELDPTHFDAYYNLGVIFQDDEDFTKATAYFQKALELNPHLDDGYFNLGTIFFLNTGQHEIGLDYYQKAFQLNPDLMEDCTRKGLIIPDKVKLREIKQHYETLPKSYPASIEYIIASYPRSGNHWVRYILEWFSKRPTLGSGDAIFKEFWDTPIHQGITMTNLGNFAVTNQEPIAIKRHALADSDDRTLGLILIARDFNECIIKHIKAHKKQKIPLQRLTSEITMYAQLLSHFDTWGNNKILIYYEDLIENYSDTIKKLLHFCNLYNDTEFNQFIHNYEDHKEKSIAYYDLKAESETKGKGTRYYLDLISDDDKLLIQTILLKEHDDIFSKYLTRYKQ